VHTNLLHQSVIVNYEHATQADTLFLNEYAIVLTNLVCRIAQQWDIDIAEPAILMRNVLPVPQRMLRVDRDECDIAVSVFELIIAVLKGNDLGRTHEGERGWDEEQQQPRSIWVRTVRRRRRSNESAQRYL